VLLGFALLLGACGDDSAVPPDAALPDGPRADAGIDAAVDATTDGPGLAQHHYVVNAIVVPQTVTQAGAFGFNLDGDSQNRVDNAFGQFLVTLSQQGIDVQSAVNLATTGGHSVELGSLGADDLVAANPATWRFFVGAPTSGPPNLSGGGMFTVAQNGAMMGTLDGSIAGGHLTAQVPAGSMARIPIKLGLVAGQAPIEFDLVGGHVAADVTANDCSNGRVGGGIAMADLANLVLPAWATAMNASITSACRTGAATGDYSNCDSNERSYLQMFDTAPMDGNISLAEVRNNSLVQTLLAPDVDLLDVAGGYNPTPGGTPDSISFGVGFSCASAIFSE